MVWPTDCITYAMDLMECPIMSTHLLDMDMDMDMGTDMGMCRGMGTDMPMLLMLHLTE